MWRRLLLYLGQLRRRSHDAIIACWLRFGLWLWFRFRARIRFWLWLRIRLRDRVRFRFLHWAIRLGHVLQALRGAFHNEAHAYQSNSGPYQAETATAGGFNFTAIRAGLGRFHTFFGTFRGIFRAERFLACARVRSGFCIHVWLRFRLWLRFRFRARLFFLLWLFWRLLRRNDLRLCRPGDLYFALGLRWTLGK